MTRQSRQILRISLALVLPLLLGTACARPTPSSGLVVYSGRSEELVSPLIRRFERASGIDVAVKWGGTAELASLIVEEGARTRADVFFSQDAGALGLLERSPASGAPPLLRPLPKSVLGRVPSRFRSARGSWVGVTGRARTVVYNTSALQKSDLPDSILSFVDPRWKGKIGWAPQNASFQAFVTALRKLRGEGEARRWLAGIRRNEPVSFEENTPIVEAAGRGEIQVGFVNHYYLLRLKAENPGLRAANHFARAGDPGSLINVAGAGILRTTDDQEGAQKFIEYLLTEETQRYFATETFEYPLLLGVPSPAGLPPIAELAASQPGLDLADLDDIEGTLDLLREAGIV